MSTLQAWIDDAKSLARTAISEAILGTEDDLGPPAPSLPTSGASRQSDFITCCRMTSTTPPRSSTTTRIPLASCLQLHRRRALTRS
ncbi:hypothetical protein SY91_06995 (plasmid) [Burkholderia cenocepacia]|nr:hypothetical protein SY91_06995 [Burkholderia cenocepacia]